jgi:hypothetical protein
MEAYETINPPLAALEQRILVSQNPGAIRVSELYQPDCVVGDETF